ncbi:jg8423 [Pararge aegeria aegeria]|uniref:Jg8423 protein n=1 Tax=Pararge aegeria aegeria TaxID=348720 RepID=A0A8S4SLB2_9NEOP|nr:jg8423 [Pararge aegeria aegeria]
MAEPEPAPAGLADAVLLAPLTEDSFLHNLHVRYKRDIIYRRASKLEPSYTGDAGRGRTPHLPPHLLVALLAHFTLKTNSRTKDKTYVGNALVSVNPCRALPLYSAELVRTYLARPPYLLPPHLYVLSSFFSDKYRHGESGAGKTEAARVCLQCAVVAGGGGGGALAAAGTLLEAFGNAATARNHNASRFLQRSWEQYRVLRGGATCAEGGCAGAGAGAGAGGAGCAGCAACAGSSVVAGGSASPRRAPPQPPPGPRAPQADKDHFAFTKAAMGALGFSAAQCGAVLRVLAFLLKLGNVQFEPQHNIDGSIGTRLQHEYVHFGGPVVYSARGIVAKNRDAVCRRCAAVLAEAREPLLAALFAPGAGAFIGRRRIKKNNDSSSGSPRRPCALACRQRALVGALVRRLPCAPRLVRCLRADAALRPHRFDSTLLRHQIRTQGIMDMALLRRAGWCESMCARAVLSRYGVLRARATPTPPPGAPASPALEARDDPVRAARALLRSLPIPSAEFAYGRTKVFIRSPRTVWELEALRAARVEKLVRGAQRAWRRYRARKRHVAAAKIVAAWRRYRKKIAAIEKRTAKRISHRNLHVEPEASGSTEASEKNIRGKAACVIWRAWTTYAKRSYLLGLWARLPARHRSPACGAWPPCPRPRLLARTDAMLRRMHHKWRCAVYRRAFDQTARNRMREKVTASVLFKDRKVTYARSVAHPFVGDYVRLRASAAWRRGLGAAAADRYVVFADVVGKVARSSGRVSRCLAVVSTSALLLLEARSLRLKRRVPAHTVYRLSLSPYADDLLVVHVRACGGVESSTEELSQCSSREPLDAPGCLFGGEGAWRRRGDVLVRTCHVLELATKLFLVVQNAVGAPPHVNISTEFEANFGQQMVTVSFHAVGGGAAGEGGARLLRRGSRMDVLL